MNAALAAVQRSSAAILVVEADPEMGRAIAEQFAADGYCVQLARTSEHARVLAAQSAPRLTILGCLEPPHSALELLREIRGTAQTRSSPWDRALPVVVLNSRARGLDLLRAFDAGADDVLVGTTSHLELRARVEAILRRVEFSAGLRSLLRVGPLLVDRCTHTATLHDRPLELRRMEFALLAHLAGEPKRVFTRDELLRAVWGYRSSGCTRTLDSHASRLRRKLHAAGDGGWVVNVWGVGYRLT